MSCVIFVVFPKEVFSTQSEFSSSAKKTTWKFIVRLQSRLYENNYKQYNNKYHNNNLVNNFEIGEKSHEQH